VEFLRELVERGYFFAKGMGDVEEGLFKVSCILCKLQCEVSMDFFGDFAKCYDVLKEFVKDFFCFFENGLVIVLCCFLFKFFESFDFITEFFLLFFPCEGGFEFLAKFKNSPGLSGDFELLGFFADEFSIALLEFDRFF